MARIDSKLKARRIAVWVGGLFLLLTAFYGYSRDDMDKALKQLRSANPLFTKGMEAFHQGERKQAAEFLQQCIRKLPRHAFASYYLANIFYLDENFPQSLEFMDKALADFDFMQELSDYVDKKEIENMESLRHVMEEIDEASFSCREARKIEFIDIQLEKKEGKLEDRIDQRQGRLQRIRAHYLYFDGNILFQLKRIPEAFERYRDALAFDPAHAGSYNNIIAILYLAEQYPRAWDFLEKAEAQGLYESLNLKLVEMVSKAMDKPTDGILSEAYFSIKPEGVDVMRFALSIPREKSWMLPLYENCYVVFNPESRQALLIDPGEWDERIPEFIRDRNLEIKAVLYTHGHSDHTGAGPRFAERFAAPVYAHSGDAEYFEVEPSVFFHEDEALELAGMKIAVLHTPGHSSGSVCFLIGEYLFSGDTLFKHDIGRVWEDDDRGADEIRKEMLKHIRDKILVLGDAVRVLPGHGRSTLVGDEKALNPFLK